jgi:hypothetical protein
VKPGSAPGLTLAKRFDIAKRQLERERKMMDALRYEIATLRRDVDTRKAELDRLYLARHMQEQRVLRVEQENALLSSEIERLKRLLPERVA